MQTDEAKFIKRKIQGGSIDVHPSEKALVVNYHLEATILGETGDAMLGEKKECQKVIRLKNLSSSTDISALAKEVVDRCQLIHPSKLAEVEQLIYYLQNRKGSSPSNKGIPVTPDRSRDASRETRPESVIPRPYSGSSSGEGSTPTESSGSGEQIKTVASMSRLEEYMELMYEGPSDKIRGSALILQLARVPENLMELSTNETVLGALARVLREEWRRSVELSTNIIYIFFCFSSFTQFHRIVIHYKVGSLCIEVIEHELHRYEQWEHELEQRRPTRNSDSNLSALSQGTTSPRHQGNQSSSLPKRVISPDVSDSTEDGVPPAKPVVRSRLEYERSLRKFHSLVRKQDQLLRVSFYLLLNLAESLKLEEKMRRRNIVGMLIRCLDRDNPDLLVLVLTFLKKLSIFRENKDDMAEHNVVEKLPRLVSWPRFDVSHLSLKLLMNLSFDGGLRAKMIRVGMLPRLVAVLAASDVRQHNTAMSILYHLSMDDRVKSMFTYTNCIPIVMKMLLEPPEKQTDSLAAALLINLALNRRNAQLMCSTNVHSVASDVGKGGGEGTENGELDAEESEAVGLKDLMKRAFRLQDALVMKIVRNISQHDGQTKVLFVEFIGDLANAVQEADCEDFVVECLAVLGNLSLPDLDYEKLLRQYNLISWFRSKLIPGVAEDDVVLEIVNFLGTVAADDACAMLLCKADAILSLIELLKAKQEDDEIVLQVVYVFFQLSKHVSTREYLLQETDAPAYLLDLMHDKNVQITKVCDATLDIIAEHREDWKKRIQVEKFRHHNTQWLDMVSSQADGASDPWGEDYAGDMEDGSYMDEGCGGTGLASGFLDRNLLSESLFQSGSHISLEAVDDIDYGSGNPSSSAPGGRPRSRYSQDIEDYAEALALNGSVDFASRLNQLFVDPPGGNGGDVVDNKGRDSVDVYADGIMDGRESVAKTQITFQ
ncbi:kinesin-associated protein 3-like [Ischnura elegans]|uniref:kinesin-associated protein 3-like n=1 Tax=Ischnura elegans TaxID=197161 RepID=UPI001ED8A49B|nr:kinesin-associated protein 3-like [Ischnura elegans]